MLFLQIRYACNECGIATEADGLTPIQMTSTTHHSHTSSRQQRQGQQMGGGGGRGGAVRRFRKFEPITSAAAADEVDVGAGVGEATLKIVQSEAAGIAAGGSHKGLADGGSTKSTTATATATTNSSSWHSLRATLFSSAALIADEQGDALAATQ